MTSSFGVICSQMFNPVCKQPSVSKLTPFCFHSVLTAFSLVGQALTLLVAVSSMRYRTSTPALSTRVRHDFRHTLHTLKMLADEKEYDSLNQYLKKYINALPVSHVITYCQNNSVNALLNYLIPIARESAVDIRIYINIPEHLPVTDIDLCSILGNVLENAIDGCKTVSSEKRSVQLSVTTRHDSYLYIVSTNTFDGIVKKEKNQYQTTRKNGHGIGLSSIQLTVEKYNGTVQFSNDDSRFYVDIMIPI